MMPRTPVHPSNFGIVASVGLAAACIIPDKHIDFEGESRNTGAVRIVEPAFISAEAHAACDAASRDVTACPTPPPTLSPYFLDPTRFCSCAVGQRDTRALRVFSFYAEDSDVDEDGALRDDLFGVLLLDYDANRGRPPYDHYAYARYLAANEPALPALSTYDYWVQRLNRTNPGLRDFFVSDGSQFVDLCNGDRLGPLPEGIHTLTFMVTDRPWFAPVLVDGDGSPKLDPQRNPLRAPPQVGVPDIAAGATYDTATYVFRCRAASDPDCVAQCVPEEES